MVLWCGGVHIYHPANGTLVTAQSKFASQAELGGIGSAVRVCPGPRAQNYLGGPAANER